MVARILVDRDIDGGRRLVEELDRARTPLRAALWMYIPDEDRYRLILATPIVDRQGPIKAYHRILKALDRVEEDIRPVATDLSAVSPRDAMIQAIGTEIHTGPGLSGIRVSRNKLGDVYVEDAYIYRLN